MSDRIILRIIIRLLMVFVIIPIVVFIFQNFDEILSWTVSAATLAAKCALVGGCSFLLIFFIIIYSSQAAGVKENQERTKVALLTLEQKFKNNPAAVSDAFRNLQDAKQAYDEQMKLSRTNYMASLALKPLQAELDKLGRQFYEFEVDLIRNEQIIDETVARLTELQREHLIDSEMIDVIEKRNNDELKVFDSKKIKKNSNNKLYSRVKPIENQKGKPEPTKKTATKKTAKINKGQSVQKIVGFTVCKKCKMKVLPKSDGSCPSCQSEIM